MTAPVDPDAPSAAGAGGRRALVAVALGGTMGTLSRYGISRAISTAPGSIPWSIFLVNVLGSLALGFVVQLILERWPTDEFIRPFVAVGFIGSFTTFSTVMVDTDLLVRDGHAGIAALYVGSSVAAGLVAAFSGIAIARSARAAGSVPVIVLIASLVIAGAIGAMSRYLADGRIQHRVARDPFARHRIWGTLPWGTILINVTGSFVLGVVVGLAQYHGLGRLPATAIGTGFCGALTTFSAFSYESIRCVEQGAILSAATNTIGSVVVGLLVAGAAIAAVAAV